LPRRFRFRAFLTYPLLSLIPALVLLLVLWFCSLVPLLVFLANLTLRQLFVIFLTSFTVVTAIGWYDVRLRKTQIGLEIGAVFRTYRKKRLRITH
jgi:hypothetical protein